MINWQHTAVKSMIVRQYTAVNAMQKNYGTKKPHNFFAKHT